MSVPSRSLEITRHRGQSGQGGALLLRLSGVIDETTRAEDLAFGLEATSDHVVFDLGEVRRITSFGVRAWMRALARLPAGRYWFVRCRPSLMTQFNTVVGFAGEGNLLSFYCPYLCTGCKRQPELLLDLRTQHQLVAAMTPPSAPCPSCAAPLEFDDVPEDYFEYAAAAPRPAPPEEVAALVDASTASRRAGLRVEQEVEETFTAVWLSGTLDGKARLSRVADVLEGRVVFVLQGLVGLEDAGRAQLVRLLSTSGIVPFLARVPASLLEAREGGEDLVGGAALLSVHAPARCDRCGPVACEVDAFHKDAVDLPCPECARPVPIELPAALRSRIVENGEMDAYLAARPRGPARAGVTNTSRPAAGHVLGRYELIAPLGVGGMAEVFLARQLGPEGFEKEVVVKRLLPHLCRDESFVQMFLQEARIVGRLSHPNVVQIFELGRAGQEYFLAMEYVRGWDLNVIAKELAAADEQMPVHVAARIVADMAAGLAAAHGFTDDAGVRRPIVHRDVSPHNVLISHAGAVKLADFGLAKAADADGATRSGQLKGKVIYMAPEHIGGAAEPASDVFAAGLVLYLLLCNEHPLRRATELQSLQAALTEDVPDVRQQRPDVPEALARVLARAVARERAARFSDGGELADALNGFLEGSGRPVTPAELASYLKRFPPKSALRRSSPELSFTPSSVGSGMVTMATLPAVLHAAPDAEDVE